MFTSLDPTQISQLPLIHDCSHGKEVPGLAGLGHISTFESKDIVYDFLTVEETRFQFLVLSEGKIDALLLFSH